LTADADIPALPVAHFQLAVELAKIAMCIVAILGCYLRGMDVTVWRGWSHTMNFALPAIIYLVMNGIVLHVARTLPPPTFQLLANTKILATALASWMFLARQITSVQWLALVLLTVGVALGQWRGGTVNGSSGTDSEAAPTSSIVLHVFNSCLSAIAGVLVERALKAPGSRGMPIFAVAMHTSMHTLVVNSLALVVFREAMPPLTRWPNAVDCVAISNEAVNGLLMAQLMRRLDSIAKNFAFSSSIFVTAGLSAVFLGYRPPQFFYVGTALAAASGCLYARQGIHGATTTEKRKTA